MELLVIRETGFAPVDPRINIDPRSARSVVRWATLGLLVVGLGACGGSSSSGQSGSGGNPGSSGSGGGPGASGGTSGATGGSGGTGGSRIGSGGVGTGGVTASGGAAETGGTLGSGGAIGGGHAGADAAGGAAGRLGGTGGGSGGAPDSGGGVTGGGGGTVPSSCGAAASAAPGDATESIKVAGMTRTFVRHVPKGYTGKTPLAVVIDYHPLGGTGASWKGSTTWGSVADSNGFIMVWPDGIGNSWNVGRCCSTAQSENVDDVAFTRAIVTTLLQEACIDTKRVYATGCSNGGGMAFKVACDAADVIAAVAPVDFDCVTGAAANPSCGSCAPARPISEIQFRGTSDTAVPYDGGSGPRGTIFPGAKENFTEWGGINQCTGTPQAVAAQSSCQAYPACGAGAQTILCTVQNGTHCGNYQSFGIVNLAWSLFQKTSLP